LFNLQLRSLEQSDFWNGMHQLVQETVEPRVQLYPRATIIYRKAGALNLRVSHYSIDAGEPVGLEFLGFEQSGEQAKNKAGDFQESDSTLSSSNNSIDANKQRVGLEPPSWFNADKEGEIAAGDILLTLNGHDMLDLNLREVVGRLKSNTAWPMKLVFARPEEVREICREDSMQNASSSSSSSSNGVGTRMGTSYEVDRAPSTGKGVGKKAAALAVENAAMKQMQEAASMLGKIGQKKKAAEKQRQQQPKEQEAADDTEEPRLDGDHGLFSPSRSGLGVLSPIPAVASSAKPRLHVPASHLQPTSAIARGTYEDGIHPFPNPFPYPSCASPVSLDDGEMGDEIVTPKFGLDESEGGEHQSHYYQVEQNVWERMNAGSEQEAHYTPAKQPVAQSVEVGRTEKGVEYSSGRNSAGSRGNEGMRGDVESIRSAWADQQSVMTLLEQGAQAGRVHENSLHRNNVAGVRTLGRNGSGPEVITLDSSSAASRANNRDGGAVSVGPVGDNSHCCADIPDAVCINSPGARHSGTRGGGGSDIKAKMSNSFHRRHASADTGGDGSGVQPNSPNVWAWLQSRAARHPLVGLFRGCGHGCNHGLISSCGWRGDPDADPAVDFTFCEEDEDEEQDLSQRGSRQSAPRPCGESRHHDGSASICSTRTESSSASNNRGVNERGVAPSSRSNEHRWNSEARVAQTATAATIATTDQGGDRQGGYTTGVVNHSYDRGDAGQRLGHLNTSTYSSTSYSSGNSSHSSIPAATELNNASDQQLLQLLHSDLGGVSQYLHAMSFVTAISRDANNKSANPSDAVAGTCGGTVTEECALQVVSHRPTFASLQLQVTQGPLERSTNHKLHQSLDAKTRMNWTKLGNMGTAAAINGFILQLNFLVPDWKEQSERLKQRNSGGDDEVKEAVYALGRDGGRAMSSRELSLALSPQTHRALELLAPGIKLPAQLRTSRGQATTGGQHQGNPREAQRIQHRGQQLERVEQSAHGQRPRLDEEALRSLGSPTRGIRSASSPRSAARLGLKPGESFISV
jgi:hypothetical protein